ncbi:histidine triad nucleotide-binding protein 3-like isoform X2 [Thalassophryne amazonica]|uniref:histidine triad nucleotide-binding protein 3-like isoform X2 n=1 Tax=Thalassophryne amazonica TaxID=390379 RepID=UPI00147147D2|nr:histidine triad nucleotide-binding protein 3-like isoform X2 [Thalassophryne amazonica]
MEEQELNSEIDESCIFCLIAHGKDKDTEIIQKNKELVCFRDIFPAAPHHYLVIPKQHIRNCFSLNEGHVDLGWGSTNRPSFRSITSTSTYSLPPARSVTTCCINSPQGQLASLMRMFYKIVSRMSLIQASVV